MSRAHNSRSSGAACSQLGLLRWLLVALLSAASPVFAAIQPGSAVQARKLYREAETHFSVGRYKRAVELYRQAYRLQPLPGFLFNIAQCFRLLNEADKAVFHFRRYLQAYPAAPERDQVERVIRQLEKESTDRPPVAGIPSAEPPTAVSPAASPSSGSSARESDVAHPEALADHLRDGGGRVLRAAVLWSGVGLAAGLLATGIVTGQMASNRADDYADPQTSPSRLQDLKDSGEALRVVSIASLVASGTLALATAVFYWFGQRHVTAVGVRASMRSNGGSVALGGRF